MEPNQHQSPDRPEADLDDVTSIIETRVASVLGRGVMDRDDLRDRLVEALSDQDVDRFEVDEYLDDDPRLIEATAGVYHLPTIADGLALTIFVDADDAADGFVRLNPWLAPLGWWLVYRDVEIEVDGRSVESRIEGRPLGDPGDPGDPGGPPRLTDVVVGPDGWLDPVAGGWASVTITGGRLRLDRCAEPPQPDPEVAAALSAAFDQFAATVTVQPLGHDEPVDLRWAPIGTPLHELLAMDADLVTRAPLAALPDLYRVAGLEIEDREVARSGFDWELVSALRQRDRVMVTHGLSQDDADAVIAVVGAALTTIDQPDLGGLGATDEERARAGLLLAAILEMGTGTVAEAFWQEVDGPARAGQLRPFVDHLAWAVEGTDVVAPAWLQARLAEHTGDSASAAAHLDAAVGPGCNHRPALVDLAGYAADRSQLGLAHSLLRRSGVLDLDAGEVAPLGDHVSMLVKEVRGYWNLGTDSVRRNDPCPCGSGRKYKRCHQDGGYLGVLERSAWLADKMRRHVAQHGGEVVDELLDVMSDGRVWWMPRLEQEAGPVAFELALWEGKLVDGFTASRGPLLPADEAELIEPWRAARRSVYEFRGFTGEQAILRDLAVGGEVNLDNVHPTVRPPKGTRVLARPVPVQGGWRSLGPMVVLRDDDMVESIIDALAADDVHATVGGLAEVFNRSRREG